MGNIIHEIAFSFDQPEYVFNTLLQLLQQEMGQPKVKTTKGMLVRESLMVLIIDADEPRARYVAELLTSGGYQPIIATDALEAFTLFLRGKCIPFIAILGKEDESKHFFLLRLSQRMMQTYGWDMSFIRLYSPSPMALKAQTTTRPLMQGPVTPPPPRLASATPFPPTPASFVAQMPPPGSFSAPAQHSQGESMQQEKKARVSLEGQSLGRFYIESLLRKSEYSDVYLTHDRLRENYVVLKAVQTASLPYHLIERSTEETTIFQMEAELLNNVSHPHILPVLNCGKSYISGSPFAYKTMPYCADGSLSNWIFQSGGTRALSVRDVSRLILQLADALQYAHDHQITYQNFKLSNILLKSTTLPPKGDKRVALPPKGEQLQVLLSDFAVAQDGSYTVRTADAFPYIAPERWEGVVLPASDQYGLAALAYELLTGRPPFQGNTEHIMKLLHTTRQPLLPSQVNPAVPPSVNNVLLRALEKKPGARFNSVSLFAGLLQRATIS